MKYIFILFFTTSISIFGQTLSSKDIEKKQQFILILGKEKHKIESEENLLIKEKWIKKIEILKIATEKHIYGNTFNGTIMIYPKRRYFETIREKLNIDCKK